MQFSQDDDTKRAIKEGLESYDVEIEFIDPPKKVKQTETIIEYTETT